MQWCNISNFMKNALEMTSLEQILWKKCLKSRKTSLLMYILFMYISRILFLKWVELRGYLIFFQAVFFVGKLRSWACIFWAFFFLVDWLCMSKLWSQLHRYPYLSGCWLSRTVGHIIWKISVGTFQIYAWFEVSSCFRGSGVKNMTKLGLGFLLVPNQQKCTWKYFCKILNSEDHVHP